MNVLNKEGMEFFENELLSETEKQLKFFERATQSRNEELGRTRLYEERVLIKGYFSLCEKEIGVLLINQNCQAILGRIRNTVESASLGWKEQEGIRYDIAESCHPEITWENYEKDGSLPKARLTSKGEVVKRLIV
jgi:hypothetical protein